MKSLLKKIMKGTNFLTKSLLCLGFLFIILQFKPKFEYTSKTLSRRDFIIQETNKFMNLQAEEYDEELIKFVRSLIHEPSMGPRNLSNPNKVDFSQYGQSTYMDNLLNKKQNGFFIEAGAYNGEDISNTLFFEIQRNWTGILIEPVPELFKSVVSKKRNAYAINVCIAEKYPSVVKFRIAKSKALSGISDLMSKNHQNRVGNTYEDVLIPCFSLNTILASIRVNTVDFFSLDLEGAELSVLKSLDLKLFNYESIIVEHNGETVRKNQIQSYMLKNGYKVTRSNGQDDFFLKVK